MQKTISGGRDNQSGQDFSGSQNTIDLANMEPFILQTPEGSKQTCKKNNVNAWLMLQEEKERI